MSDFQVIETQEALDAVISDRIKQERDVQTKKYEGYVSPDDFKQKTGDYEKQISELNKALQQAQEKEASHNKELEERDGKIRQYETQSIKIRVANEAGLPYSAIEFLRGEDEETIRKSAEGLKGLVGARDEAPLAEVDASGNDADAALKTTLRNLNKGE